jgi:hypothetical protein
MENNMKVIKPSTKWMKEKNKIHIFLAGSIEMGKALDWQGKTEQFLSKTKFVDKIIVLNPRRDDWDSSWKQTIEDENFNEQVNWELDSQELCDIEAVYFDPKTKSPISLLELGLFHDKNIVVCCPNGFYRQGNVEIVCRKYGLTFTKTIEDFLKEIYKKIQFLLS